MNVLLLGNGFDIYYKLPTKYANFLHVASYLSSHWPQNAQFVGEVLAQDEIHKDDPYIKACYLAHKAIFDSTPIDTEKVEELVSIIRKNRWFAFLHKALNKDVGWIDFEKEIAYVVSCFMSILPADRKSFSYKSHRYGKSIVESFGFLIDQYATNNSAVLGDQVVNTDYCIERPFGSGNYYVNKEKVAKYLSDELHELARALNLYLSCFVESISQSLRKEVICERIPIFKHIEKTVTFNYTRTYENVYLTENTFHIHGSIDKEIVLGINPDSTDDVKTADTSFIAFKKYYQRTLYETDYEYIQWASDINRTQQSYRLLVMGHSLDITDKDILLDLFDHAKEIIILYHDVDAKSSYIANLVKLYGKTGFDALRRNQMLTFLPLDSDFSALAQKYTDEAFANLITDIDPPTII